MSKPDIEVLLVEDDIGDIKLTEECIKSLDVTVVLNIVEDGEKALNYLNRINPYQEAVTPELILLDLNLPKISGWEVLSHVRGLEVLKDIPVIVLTTTDTDSDIERAYQLGVNCFITKPVDFNDFCYAMKKAFNFWFRID